MVASNNQRTQMIQRLVAHSVSTARAEAQAHWLTEIFEHGFGGYSNLSDHQLRVEMQLRGLAPHTDNGITDDDTDAGDDDDDFDADFDNHNPRARRALQRMRRHF